MVAERLALRLLQIWVVAALVVPSDMVVRPLGGAAHLANLVGLILGAWWVAAVVTPRLRGVADDPDGVWRPGTVHLAVALVWLATFTAWVALARRGADDLTWNGADRWVMVVAAYSGVALVAADGLRRLDQIHRLMSTAVTAGAIASVVGLVQWRTEVDPSSWLRSVPGFSRVGDVTQTVLTRGSVGRVTGTAVHPIEFGVGAALLLPMALHLLVHDRRRSGLRRTVPLVLCALAVPLSVSRSSVVVVVVAVSIMVLTLPPAHRLTGLLATPVVAGLVLLAAPGTASTLTTSFLSAADDTSVQSRLDDVSLVGRLVAEHPWWGLGAGTYRPGDVFEILDNQYLLTLVEFGIVGTALFVAGSLILPWHLSGRLRRQFGQPAARSLGAMGLAVTAGAGMAWATFDAWAFPHFVALSALTSGVLGAALRLTGSPVLLPTSSPRSPDTNKELTSWTC